MYIYKTCKSVYTKIDQLLLGVGVTGGLYFILFTHVHFLR